MKIRLTLILLVLALLPVVHLVAAEPVTITLDPDKVTGKIDEKIYSHFLEHIFHSLNGGLWGEMIWDRSFEGSGGAKWKIQDNCIAQTSTNSDVRLTFGQPDWKNYEFTLEAQKTGGNEGFFVIFREKNDKEFFWINFGCAGNDRFVMDRAIKGEKRRGVTKSATGTIETGKWYTVRVRCEGPHIQAWLDGKLVFDYTDDGRGNLAGKVGVATWYTKAKFRNLKVTSLDGKELFAGLPELAKAAMTPGWESYGPGKTELVTENPFNSLTCQMISADGTETGVAQSPMALREGDTYRGSFYVRGESPDGVILRVTSGDVKVFEKVFPAPTAEWKEVPFEFKSALTSTSAVLQIGIVKGKACIDQVSMMADSSKATGGFRPDLLKAVADLRPPVIRWPGGSFVHTYHWKDGIGPQTKRKAGDRMMWEDREVNSYGTDEFIAMCRKIGTEALIVVNIGHRDPNNRAQYLAEACEWVEYCNGPATSKWGAVRAANGHPEPYNVKYWEIDNEIWSMKPDDYVAAIKQFAPAMKKVDPSIILLACGSGQLGGHWADGDTAVITQAADLVDYLSIHHYEKPEKFADGPAEEEAFISKLAKMIAESKNPKLKLFVSEWNAQSIDWRTGLYAGGILNVFERCGDTVGLAAPALFLRHLSAKSWNNAFINFDHTGWFPAPNYVVMKLWRDHYAPNLISATGDMGGLNAVATRSANGKTVYFKAVNPTEQAEVTTLMMPDNFDIDKTAMEQVSPGSVEAVNSLATPDAVKVIAGEVKTSGHAVSFTIPAYSAAVVTIQKK